MMTSIVLFPSVSGAPVSGFRAAPATSARPVEPVILGPRASRGKAFSPLLAGYAVRPGRLARATTRPRRRPAPIRRAAACRPVHTSTGPNSRQRSPPARLARRPHTRLTPFSAPLATGHSPLASSPSLVARRWSLVAVACSLVASGWWLPTPIQGVGVSCQSLYRKLGVRFRPDFSPSPGREFRESLMAERIKKYFKFPAFRESSTI